MTKRWGSHWLSQSAAQGNTYANSLLQHQNSGKPPNVFLGVTRLLHHMGRIFQENSLPHSNPGGIRIDRKHWAELQEMRVALGHAPDDHEDELNYKYMEPSM